MVARDNRLFVEAVLYRYRAGIPSRDLPERFGDGVVVHLRVSRWAKAVGRSGFSTISRPMPTRICDDRQHHRARSSA